MVRRSTAGTRLLTIALAVTISGLSVLPGAPTVVRAQTPVPQQAPRATEPADVSERELEAFAQSFLELSRVRIRYERTLRDVGDAERAKQLQREANARMEAAIERNGLTPQRYHEIYLTVLRDDALRERTYDAIRRVQAE